MKIFILAFSILIGIGAFYYGIKMLRLYTRVKKWTKVKATILEKKITGRKLANASRANLIVVVEYVYSFHNKNYKGNKIFLVELLNGERSFYRDDAEKFMAKLQTEQDILVNPDNPEESVMFCEGAGLYFLMLVMGVISILAGLINYVS
jgi:hypothetical protein